MNFFFTVALIHFLGVASPGPDFVLVIRNALNKGKQAGVATSLGIMLGVLFHLSYCLLGLAVIIKTTPVLFLTLKCICGIYLCYLGITSFLPEKQNHAKESVSYKNTNSIREGFLCNLLNPKCTLFFWSLFAVLLTPEIPFYIQLICCAEMLLMNFLWFSFLSFTVTHKNIRNRLEKWQFWLNRIMGAVLILLAIGIIFG